MARGSFVASTSTCGGASFSSPGGKLRIGLVAFNKHIAQELTERMSGPRVVMGGSAEQQAVWQELIEGDKHVVVEAVAGSGKTFTLVQYAYRMPDAVVECMTYHSLGFKAVRSAVKAACRVDQYKVMTMLDDMRLPVDRKQEKTAKYRISSMVSYAKTYGKDDRITEEDLEFIADRHDVDLNGLKGLVFEYTPKVLRRCMTDLSTVDFDDMVWLPMVLDLPVPQYDVLCVDEYQDTGLTQQWLAVRGGKRVVAVGDKNQAIYGFRGADGSGFDRLREKLGNTSQGIITLPLNFTRRCPQSHVRLAKQLVPCIEAVEGAPEGVVRVTGTVDEAVAEMRPGDLVVCRVNAELIGVAYKLLKRGVKAVVRGRDIGVGLTKLIDAGLKRVGIGYGELPVVPLSDVVTACGEITQEACAKFNAIPNGRGEMRAANAQDRYDCLCELAQAVGTVGELQQVITRLFEDFEEDGAPKNAVVLGTVHRTKGLEGERVFVLRPDLMPHPMAKRKEDQAGERNLAYVAVTRCKGGKETGTGELVFVGGWCGLFAGVNEHPFDVLEMELTGDGMDDSSLRFVETTSAVERVLDSIEDKYPNEFPNEFPGDEQERYAEWGREDE